VICCATPSKLYLEETRSTFQFASQVKLVKIRACTNEVMTRGAAIKRLKCKLLDLRMKISQCENCKENVDPSDPPTKFCKEKSLSKYGASNKKSEHERPFKNVRNDCNSRSKSDTNDDEKKMDFNSLLPYLSSDNEGANVEEMELNTEMQQTQESHLVELQELTEKFVIEKRLVKDEAQSMRIDYEKELENLTNDCTEIDTAECKNKMEKLQIEHSNSMRNLQGLLNESQTQCMQHKLHLKNALDKNNATQEIHLLELQELNKKFNKEKLQLNNTIQKMQESHSVELQKFAEEKTLLKDEAQRMRSYYERKLDVTNDFSTNIETPATEYKIEIEKLQTEGSNSMRNLQGFLNESQTQGAQKLTGRENIAAMHKHQSVELQELNKQVVREKCQLKDQAQTKRVHCKRKLRDPRENLTCALRNITSRRRKAAGFLVRTESGRRIAC